MRMPEENPVPVDALQFRRAETVARSCVACKLPIAGEYFRVGDQTICPSCASRIQAGRQAAQSIPLLRPAIFGAGAAVAGCLLYAAVAAMGVQIGIVALAVGWMVGKAIRKGAYGLGGRPLQIMAVALTYFAISASILPEIAFLAMKRGKAFPSIPPKSLLFLATVSPFLEVAGSIAGGLISLFILFIGLQRAWAMTARHEIMVTGPYS